MLDVYFSLLNESIYINRAILSRVSLFTKSSDPIQINKDPVISSISGGLRNADCRNPNYTLLTSLVRFCEFRLSLDASGLTENLPQRSIQASKRILIVLNNCC